MSPVILLPDIERGPSWGEDFRAECEARFVARMLREQRSAYYDAVARRRGEAAARVLMRRAREILLAKR